jgi:site-specific DNA-methyltransferase (adenine-specific)
MLEINQIHNMDCLQGLKQIPDNSVDSIVTDPPYGLNNGQKGLSDIFIPQLFDVFLPKLYKIIFKAFDNAELSLPSDRISLLNTVNGFFIDTGVSVPKSSVDFYNDFVDWNEEIKNANKSTPVIPDSVLLDKINSHIKENGYNFFLKVRHCVNSQLGDLATGGFTQFGFGSVSMAVVIPFNSLFASFLRSLTPSDVSGLADVIRLLNDPDAFTESPASVMTSAGTELRTILTLNLTDGSFKITPTSGTSKFDTVFEIVSPENIGTLTATSGLSSVFKPFSFSSVGRSTNGTFSLYIHNYIIPQINKKSSGFMGKKWDYDVPKVEIWKECLRVLKPGGHLLAFAGTRSQHRMAVNIEDAGFEIRDMIAWVYGSGFPKSRNIWKTDIQEEVESQIRAQGLKGEIQWK